MKYVFYLIIGAALGFFLSWLNRSINSVVHVPESVLFTIEIVLLGISSRILITGFYYLKYIRPIFRGEYDKALVKFEQALNKKWRSNELKNIAFYNIANIYHRQGKFEESIEWLEKIKPDKVKRNLKGCYYGLYATNLLMLERQIDTAEQYLDIASGLVKSPSQNLLYIYLYLLKKEIEKAEAKKEEYLKACKKSHKLSFGFEVLIYDKDFFKVTENLIMGLYYQAIDEINQAEEYFKKASLGTYDNFYKSKAIELLKHIG